MSFANVGLVIFTHKRGDMIFYSPSYILLIILYPIILSHSQNRVSPGGLQEVGKGALKKIQLEGNKCFLLDIGAEIFVWFGRIAPLEDKKAAGVAAEVGNKL